MDTRRIIAAVIAAAGPVLAPADTTGGAQPGRAASAVRAGATMPSLDGAVAWINSRPLTAPELRGKVVLVDIWTYSCINWQRTLPHVRAWADKYRDHGLVVIGVHSPEFGFEKDLDRVRQATRQLGVAWPVAVDSRHAIWRAFDNEYWPALYFVDAKGVVRHRHFGEGDYERSERMIQQLLMEAGVKDVPTGLVEAKGSGAQAEADWGELRSPEAYVGHARAENFASPGGLSQDQTRRYEAPQSLGSNTWALSGEWTVGAEAATLARPNGRIVHRFHARDLHLVMGPAAQGRPVPFRVLLDGRPPGADAGADVDAQGRGLLVEHRLHQLIRQQPGTVRDHQFEIEFLEPGAQAYAFTFG